MSKVFSQAVYVLVALKAGCLKKMLRIVSSHIGPRPSVLRRYPTNLLSVLLYLALMIGSSNERSNGNTGAMSLGDMILNYFIDFAVSLL